MIWLIGNKGMLGSDVQVLLKKKSIPYLASDKEVDICDLAQLKKLAHGKKIKWIINCSAYTAVDLAEDEEEAAYRINRDGVRNIALVAKDLNAKLIHISTDYVFDGTKGRGYTEDDEPNPASVYGKSKLAGEIEIKNVLKEYFIIRTAWLYGRGGKNFVSTMLKLFNERDEVKVVNDQFGSPTSSVNLARAIVEIVVGNEAKFGIYNFTDDGRISWHDFAVYIYNEAKGLGLVKRDVKILPIPTSEYKTKAIRPANSYLLKDKLKNELGVEILDWKTALHNFMNKLIS